MNKYFEHWLTAAQLVTGVVAFVWVVTLLNSTVGFELNRFGLQPRDIDALTGLLFWVWLHADFNHLIVNTPLLVVLGFFVSLRGPKLFIKITMLVWLLTGIAVWLVGRPAIHIGSSAIVFGYFGFLLAVALYERRLTDLAVASLVIFYYGGLFFGVLPTQSFVSWEAHLFGLISGVVAARLFGKDWVGADSR